MQRFDERDAFDVALHTFRLFDTTGRGRISVNDLGSAAKSLGLSLTGADLSSMISSFDRNGSGELDEADFIRVMTSIGLP